MDFDLGAAAVKQLNGSLELLMGINLNLWNKVNFMVENDWKEEASPGYDAAYRQWMERMVTNNLKWLAGRMDETVVATSEREAGLTRHNEGWQSPELVMLY